MLNPILLLSILTSFLFANIPLLNNTTTTYTYDSQGKKTKTQLSISEMIYILKAVRLASRLGEDDRDEDNIPIQVYGSNNLPEHQQHIFDSMIGLGSSRYPTSAVLNKKDGERNDKFLDCALPTATGLCRDEYPYNSTYQGGEANYNAGKVSVRYVSRRESSRQGNFIKRFYNEVPLNDKDTFLVIPIGSATGFFNKSGQWNSVPKY